MRTTRHLLAVTIGAAMLLTSTAVAASAQSTTIKDKRADVTVFSDGSDGGTVLGKADSTASGVDVTSMKVKHSKKTVVVTVKFSNLSKQTLFSAGVRVNGKTKPSYSVFGISRKKGVVTNDSGDKQKCTFPLKTKYGKSGYIKATIKRSCLGKPKKIKLQGGAVKFDESDPTFVAFDAISAKKVQNPDWTRWLKAS